MIFRRESVILRKPVIRCEPFVEFSETLNQVLLKLTWLICSIICTIAKFTLQMREMIAAQRETLDLHQCLKIWIGDLVWFCFLDTEKEWKLMLICFLFFFISRKNGNWYWERMKIDLVLQNKKEWELIWSWYWKITVFIYSNGWLVFMINIYIFCLICIISWCF